MQIDGNYLDVVIWFVCFRIGFSIADLLTHFHTLYNSSKYRMFVIQPWLWKITKKKQGGILRKSDHHVMHTIWMMIIETLPLAKL